jgi:hypothetical protein
MLHELIKFPLFKNDDRGLFPLNNVQRSALNSYKRKIYIKEYNLVKNYCLCGNRDNEKDIIIIWQNEKLSK